MSIQLLFNRVVYLGGLFPGCQQGGLFTLLLDICGFFVLWLAFRVAQSSAVCAASTLEGFVPAEARLCA